VKLAHGWGDPKPEEQTRANRQTLPLLPLYPMLRLARLIAGPKTLSAETCMRDALVRTVVKVLCLFEGTFVAIPGANQCII
jgi:hypothetical protein